MKNAFERNFYKDARTGIFYYRIMLFGFILDRSLFTRDYKTAVRRFEQKMDEIWFMRQNNDMTLVHNLLRKKKRVKLDVALQMWVKDSEGQKQDITTIRGKRAVAGFIRRCGIKYIEDFDQKALERVYALYDAEKEYAQNTKWLVNKRIKAFLHYCNKLSLLPEEKTSKFEFRLIKRKKKDNSCVVTQEEYERIVEEVSVEPPRAMFIKLLWNCGLRPESEGLQLKYSDIHFAERYIHVWQPKVEAFKDIPITVEFALELKAFCKQYNLSGNMPLFKGHKWMKGRGDAYLIKYFSKVVKKLGISPNITLMSFRHSLATRFSRNQELTRRMLGHSSFEMMKNYVHSIAASSVEMLDELVGLG